MTKVLDLGAVAARPREIVEVAIDGYDDSVFVRVPTAGDFLRAESAYPNEVSFALLAVCICNQQGELLYTLDDDTIDLLKRLPLGIVKGINDALNDELGTLSKN